MGRQHRGTGRMGTPINLHGWNNGCPESTPPGRTGVEWGHPLISMAGIMDVPNLPESTDRIMDVPNLRRRFMGVPNIPNIVSGHCKSKV